MLPFSKFTGKLKTIGLVGGILVAAGLGFYLYVHPGAFHKPDVMQDAEVSKPDNKIKINTETALVQHILYTKCNDEEVLQTKAPDTVAGFTLAQVQQVYPGWTINKFDTAEVDMTLKVDSYCREHANNMFLGIKDGHVAVFYGKPGPKAIVKEVTAIPVNRLMEQDLTELRQGLVVNSKEEMLRTIEGLQSR
ncbi:BofC C-terminal domain-containing protein [Propionispora hippei]|uniref:BofC C-terminal domain-containing protein n=1 Tax=Propionispora hippei DSM 15287 TaxID=1123003 RepID=A0A1M6AGR4_9FIRM|nr:BofC C-terminal domain-containing protein [Propionispora hippei]SHI35726.1 BofC C-terminal domain-containing protein [Propionispora hippei DSM 15287]